MGRVSTCQKNCNTIDLRRAQVKNAFMVWFFLRLKALFCVQYTIPPPAAM